MAQTNQFKIRLDEELIGRLERLADRYSRRSANEVAAEVIAQYLDFWEYAEKAKHAALLEQRAALTERVPVVGNPKPKGKGGK